MERFGTKKYAMGRSMTDAQIDRLIKKAKKGNKHAFERLLRQKENNIAYIALRMLRNERDAEDAVQEAVLSMYRSIKDLNDSKSFNSWMYKTVYRACLHVQDKRKKGSGVELDDGIESSMIEEREELIPEMSQEGRERREYLIEKLNLLPEKHCTAMYLFYFEDMPYAEIAKVMDCSKNNVSNWLERGKAKLRSELAKDGITDKKETQKLLSVASLGAVFIADQENLLTLEQKNMVKDALEVTLGIGGAGIISSLAATISGASQAFLASKYFNLVVGGLSVLAALFVTISFSSLYHQVPPVEDIPVVETPQEEDHTTRKPEKNNAEEKEEDSKDDEEKETPPSQEAEVGENTVTDESNEDGYYFVIENKVYYEIMDEYDEEKLTSEEDPDLVSNKVSAVASSGQPVSPLVKTGDVFFYGGIVLGAIALAAVIARIASKKRS